MTAESPASSALAEFGNVGRLRELLQPLRSSPSAYHARHLGGLVDVAAADAVGRLAEIWTSVPPTTKAELLDDQAAAPPYGTRLLVPRSRLHLVVESSGSTSGVREVHALTAADEQRVLQMMSECFREVGLVDDDCVAITLPIGTAGGGAKVYHTVRAIGALALRLGALSTEEKAAAICSFRPTVIVATPHYLDRLALSIRSQGHDPAGLGVRTVLIATQSVSVEWVRRVRRTWNASVHEWYGNASGFFAMTCRHGVADDDDRWGTLHWDPDFQLLEMVDDGRLAGDGEYGELLGTHLANATSPLLRYRLGDEAQFVPAGTCACGSSRPGLRAGTIRRADGMVKFRAVSLWPSAVDRVLAGVAGIDSSWVVLRTDDRAAEIAECYVRPATGRDFDYEAVAARVREATGVRFAVIPWENDEAPEPCRVVRANGKSPRWVDLRQTTS